MSESEYSLIQYENESRPVATNQCSGPEFERLCLLHEPQNLCPSCGGSARDEELNGGGRVYGLGDEWYCCDWTITIMKAANDANQTTDLGGCAAGAVGPPGGGEALWR